MNERELAKKQIKDALKTAHTHIASIKDPDTCAYCGENFRFHFESGEDLESRLVELLLTYRKQVAEEDRNKALEKVRVEKIPEFYKGDYISNPNSEFVRGWNSCLKRFAAAIREVGK
ncbi:hypothetical protein KKH13_05060 [Patescibacteria group bacterium]|nr:hypothetical protein [Patescibacteria group bacterium]